MKFEYGLYSLNFQIDGGSYPGERPFELTQISDRTAAGTLQIEDLGLNIERRNLAFDALPKVDYDALLNWYLNVCKGAKNSFYFTDEYGNRRLVKITSDVYNFREVFFERFEGSLTLEYVNE